MIKQNGFVKSKESIKNGNFSYPLLSTNNKLTIRTGNKSTILTNEFIKSFGWSFTQSDINENTNLNRIILEIINGNSIIPTVNPYIIGVNAYLLIMNNQPIVSPYQTTSYQTTLYQTINIIQTGIYKLSFYYCKRAFIFNTINIYLNDTIFDSIINTPISFDWVFYTKQINVNNLNDLKISFTGTSTGESATFIITKISMICEEPLKQIKVFPTNFSTQVTTQTHHKITNTGLNENTKKWIGGAKNRDSSAFIKKKTSHTITQTSHFNR